MSTIWTVSVSAWAALTLGVIALAIYRRVLARSECDVLHLRDSEIPLVPRQEEFAHRLEKLDLWGKILTFAVVLCGLVLGVLFLYQAWSQGIAA